MKQIVIKAERRRLGSTAQSRAGSRLDEETAFAFRVARHSCAIICQLEQMELSVVQITVRFIIRDTRGEKMLITNQQNCQFNLLSNELITAPVHTYIHIQHVSYTTAALVPALMPTAVYYISRYSNRIAISMPYLAFVRACGLIDFQVIHFLENLENVTQCGSDGV